MLQLYLDVLRGCLEDFWWFITSAGRREKKAISHFKEESSFSILL